MEPSVAIRDWGNVVRDKENGLEVKDKEFGNSKT